MDELVKRLRELASIPEHCDNVESCDGCSKEDICLSFTNERIIETAVKAADAIEELLAERDEVNADSWKTAFEVERDEHRWISVTERLPEDLTRVIVFCEDGVSFGLCEHLIADDEEVVEWHDFLHYPITPTHWMPLPEPPREEGEW